MEIVKRSDMIGIIASKMNLTNVSVKRVLTEYTDYILESIRSGRSIGVMRICYINVDGYDGPRETFSYTCTEVSRKLGIPGEVVKGILSYYEECIIRDLKSLYNHTLYSLISLKMEDDWHGNTKVSVRKSSVLRDVDCRLQVSRGFKRKVNRMAVIE